jgi:hypothetical protein
MVLMACLIPAPYTNCKPFVRMYKIIIFSLSNHFHYGRLFTSGGLNELALSFAMRLWDEIRNLATLDRIISQVNSIKLNIYAN